MFIGDQYKGGDADKSGELIYYPKQFDEKNHQGFTKKQLIKKEELLLKEQKKGLKFPGLHIIMTEDFPNPPTLAQAKLINGRFQLHAGLTPEQYLEKFQNDKQYQGEKGFTPEDYFIFFNTYLYNENYIIDLKYEIFLPGLYVLDPEINIDAVAFFSYEDYYDQFIFSAIEYTDFVAAEEVKQAGRSGIII